VTAFVNSFDHKEAWEEAIFIGRAFSALNRFPFSNARMKAVADAATRIKKKGYHLKIYSDKFHIEKTDIEKIVNEIAKNLQQLGCLNALNNIMRVALASHTYAYEQFLFGRGYAKGLGDRPPATPIGLLYNIAVKLPVRAPSASNPAAAWDSALKNPLIFEGLNFATALSRNDLLTNRFCGLRDNAGDGSSA
jgi:hypothetical protein